MAVMKKILYFLLFSLSLCAHEKTYVESDEAHYDGAKIILEGNVFVKNGMGTIHADKATLIRDETGQTSIDFPWVELSDHVILTLTEGGYLSCAFLFLDHPQLTAHFQGAPLVTYIDTCGEVSAEHVQIDYIQKEQKVTPVKITLTGSVCLSRMDENEQYALAEKVEYFPEHERMIFTGTKERVLFFDKKRDIQLSAFSVIAEKNPETKRESVRGVGDVRFVLGQEELIQLKERFH